MNTNMNRLHVLATMLDSAIDSLGENFGPSNVNDVIRQLLAITDELRNAARKADETHLTSPDRGTIAFAAGVLAVFLVPEGDLDYNALRAVRSPTGRDMTLALIELADVHLDDEQRRMLQDGRAQGPGILRRGASPLEIVRELHAVVEGLETQIERAERAAGIT